MPKPTARLSTLEASRGVAASLVVLVHAASIMSLPRDYGVPPLGDFFVFGHIGVDFFFVLSGFIISFVHWRDVGRPAALGRYAWRRVVRVYPVFWTVMLGYLLILLVSPSRDRYERNPLALLTSLLLLPRDGHAPILGPSWTLQHEVLFYIVFAAALLNARAGAALLLGWLALILLHVATGMFPAFPGDFLFGAFNAQFFFGIAVTLVLRRRRAARPFVCFWLGLFLFSATGLLQYWMLPQPVPPLVMPAGCALGAAFIIYGLASAEEAGRMRALPRWLMAIGAASYSIYLTHVVSIMLVMQGARVLRRLVWLPEDVVFAALVAAALCLGVLFSVGVEQPLLRALRGLGRGRAVAG